MRGDGDDGLNTISAGIYRYNSDDQVYMVNLNVSGSSAHFQSGMNTIILPRAIALRCQLNDTLYYLQHVGNMPLNNVSFYSTDPLKATASGHIIAVISKNVTASQAEAILTMLTHDATNGRVGNNVTISSSALYLLHLPCDILSAIPTTVENAGLGSGPSYFSWGGLIKTIVNMTFNFLFWWAAGGVLLLWLHLKAIGLETLGGLWAGVGAMVEDAVDHIVDGLNALKNLLLDFVYDTILPSISSFIGDIWNVVVSWGSGLVASLYRLGGQVDFGSMSVAQAADQFVDALIFNGVFLCVVALAIALYAVMLVLNPVIAPYAFVLSEVAPLLIIAILMGGSGLLNGASSSGIAMASDIVDLISEFLGDGLVIFETTMWSIITGVVGTLMTSVAAAVKVCANTFLSFVVSIVGAILSFAALTQINEQTTMDWVIASVIGFILSAYGFYLSLTGPNLDGKICPGFNAVSDLISGLGFGVSILSLGETYQKFASRG